MKYYHVFSMFTAAQVLATQFNFALCDDQKEMGLVRPIRQSRKKEQLRSNLLMPPNQRGLQVSEEEWTLMGQQIDSLGGDAYDRPVALSHDGLTVAIGFPYHLSLGSVTVYSFVDGQWKQLGETIEGETGLGDIAGWSISLSGDGRILAVGDPKHDGNESDSGLVRVYQYVGSSWIQRGGDIYGDPGEQTGTRVSLSENGNVVAIGAPYNSDNGTSSGTVRVYEYSASDNSWTQLGNDIRGEEAMSYSGFTVSLSDDGSVVAIGATENSGGGTKSGHVRVYEYNGNIWTQRGQDIDGEGTYDYSGSSLCLSGDGNTVGIGAAANDNPNGDNAGHVRVYRFSAGSWTKLAQDIDGDARVEEMGSAVSLSQNGNIVAVGSRLSDINGHYSGLVRVLEYNSDGNMWEKIGQDLYGDAETRLGITLSLSADGHILAAPRTTGGTYIYKLLGPSPSPSFSPSSSPTILSSDVPSTFHSLAPSFPTWEIANGNMENYLTETTSYITMKHAIGTAKEAVLKLTLYDYDCKVEFDSDEGVSLLKIEEGIANREASYNVVLAKDSLGLSGFLVGTDKLKFCVEAALHHSQDEYNWGSVVSKKTQFDITFDLDNAQFSVTFQTQGENPDINDPIEVDDDFYEMKACICTSPFACDEDDGVVPAQQENSVVFICLFPPEGLKFTGFDMHISKVDDDPATQDFTYEAMGAPFTSTENSGNDIRVRTQLLSGLFDVGVVGSAQITGSGTLEFDTNTKDGKDEDEVKGEYAMFLPLVEGEGEGSGSLVDCLFGKLAEMMGYSEE